MRDEHLIQKWAPILGEVKERDAELGSATHGAFLFHQWAASRLPRNVRAHYGEFFVLGAHHLLAVHFSVLSGVRKLLYRKPDPSVFPVCRGCKCKPEDATADRKPKPSVIRDCLLIEQFNCVYKGISSKSIAEWYFGLFVPDAINVRAFFRAAAPADPLIREVRSQILLQQGEGLKLEEVALRGKRGRSRKSLRDAFAVTAMLAVHEWLDIKLVEGTNKDCTDDCAAFVASRFGIAAKLSGGVGMMSLQKCARTTGSTSRPHFNLAYFLRTRRQ